MLDAKWFPARPGYLRSKNSKTLPHSAIYAVLRRPRQQAKVEFHLSVRPGISTFLEEFWRQRGLCATRRRWSLATGLSHLDSRRLLSRLRVERQGDEARLNQPVDDPLKLCGSRSADRYACLKVLCQRLACQIGRAHARR